MHRFSTLPTPPRNSLKGLNLAALCCAFLLAGCAVQPVADVQGPYGQPSVVYAEPPPLREIPGAPPGPGYVWVGGHWRWMRSQHVWMSGHWQPVAAPRYMPIEPPYQHAPRVMREPDRRWHDAMPRSERQADDPRRQPEPSLRRERHREFAPRPVPQSASPVSTPVAPTAPVAVPPSRPGSDDASASEPPRKGSIPGQPSWKRNRGQEAQ
jgi:hypothetical protein